MTKSLLELIAMIVLLAILISVLFSLVATMFMLLWNWIAAGVFGLPELTFWTSLGFLLLVGMIRGSIVSLNNK